MSAHTPGPWEVGETYQGSIPIRPKGTGWLIGFTNKHDDPLGDTDPCGHAEANARLIAAAPELLAALRDLREACATSYKLGQISAEPFVRAGNIIAKAEGR